VFSSLPFIETVLTHEHGKDLAAVCSLDLERCPALRHHTLGRDVSADDPALPGLPVVPFTVMMEIMAEAATALAPGQVVVEMRDVRVYRWVGLDLGPVTFEIRAQHARDGRVSVRLLEAGTKGSAPIAEGAIVLGASYPPAPVAVPLHLPDERPYRHPTGCTTRPFPRPPSAACAPWIAVVAGPSLARVPDRSGLDDGRAVGWSPICPRSPGQVVSFCQMLDRGHPCCRIAAVAGCTPAAALRRTAW
jgi:hypothetical protein